MSLKEWLFGAEVPGTEKTSDAAEKKPESPPPTDTKKDPSQVSDKAAGKAAEKANDKTPDPKAEEVKPAEKPKKSEDDSKSEPFTKPAEKPAHSGQTQSFTKADIEKLGKSEKEQKTIKFVPPTKSSKPAESPDKTDAKPAEKTKADPPPTPTPTPLIAATWKVTAVNEDWAPEAVTKAFPELARNNYQDHEIAERILPGNWRMIGGSRRGRKQAHDSRFREDAMAFGHTATVTVLCVGDGAGSSKYSRIGSHVAVNEIVAAAISAVERISKDERKDADRLEKTLRNLLSETVRKARAKVVAVAEKSHLDAKEFRTTLLTILHYHADGKEFLLSNQVGDGAISLLMKDDSVKKFGESDSGDFSGEVSCFLTDKEADEKAGNVQLITEVDKVEAMFLCSDGIEDPFYPIEKRALDIYRQWRYGVEEPIEGFKTQAKQAAVFKQEAAAWALAQWLEFEKRGENDDRTIMIMHRHPATDLSQSQSSAPGTTG